MDSLRHMTFPGLLALLATLALRMEAGEAEWLAASLLQATAHLRALLPPCPEWPARPPDRPRLPPAHRPSPWMLEPRP
jgi:hypothetical protein